MGPIRGKGPIRASESVGGKFTSARLFSVIRDALIAASKSPAAAAPLEEAFEMRDFAVRSASSNSLDSGISESPIVADQGYLLGKGPLPFEPHFPSQVPSGEYKEMLAEYQERMETQSRGHLEMAELDLTDISKKQAEVDLPRQINMIKGKEVSAEEFFKQFGNNQTVMSYANQALFAPLGTEIFMRYCCPEITMVSSDDGIAVNYYQNEEGEDCIEGVWLGSIKEMANQKVIYDIEGRVDVNLVTKKAEIDWKITDSIEGQKERYFSMRHFSEEGQALHSKVRKNG